MKKILMALFGLLLAVTANAAPYNNPDLGYIEHVIEQTYGDKVSFHQKAKPLLKFGTRTLVGICDWL